MTSPKSPINPAQTGSIYHIRQNRLAKAMQAAGLESLVINPGPSLIYLTGLHFHLMERPVVAIFTSGNAPKLVLPELEVGKTRNLPFLLQTFTYSDNPVTWQNAFDQAVRAAEINALPVGLEPTRLRVLELRFLEAAAPLAKFISAEDCLAELRMRKDQDEISLMKRAVEIAQNALKETLPSIRAGISERELASDFMFRLMKAGSESDMPFAPIVASGPNSANPHSVPSSRILEAGDLLILDWGAVYGGYISDLTRTFAIGEPDDEFTKIYHIVEQANAAARATARPGIPAGYVDRAARNVIDQAGYGQFFIHRTGHGIGMEGHEGPYMYAENELILAPGMAFTIEPGIYLPGRGGVRIEDDVIITETGAESLSDYPRELTVIRK